MTQGARTAGMIILAAVALLRPALSLAGYVEGPRPVPNGMFDEIKSMILEEIGEGRLPSASVAVAKAGEIIWLESFGYADIEKKVPATPHTPYPIASITKQLTATATMVLAERGVIDVHAPVRDYVAPLELKAYRGDFGDLTVKHLLNHTGGLPMHFDYYYEDEDFVPPGDIEVLERYGFLIHAPGEFFQYANLGYALLGHVISGVANAPYAAFMRDEVLEPLGLEHTWVGSHSDGPLPAATKYDTRLRAIPQALPYAAAAGGGFSSAHDLVRLGMFHLQDNLPGQKKILSDASIDIMQSAKDENAEYVSEDYYGYGWFFRENEGGYKVCWHEGGMGGARSILKLVPSEDIAVVVLLNGWNDELPGLLAKKAIGALLPGYLEALESDKGVQSPPFASYEALPEFTGTWGGAIKTHEGDVMVYMVFQEDNDIHFIKQLDIDKSWVLQNQTFFDRVLNNTGIKGDRIYGWVDARIPTADAMRLPHVLAVDLVREGERLNGSVSAVSAAERMYFGYSYYISLEKMK